MPLLAVSRSDAVEDHGLPFHKRAQHIHSISTTLLLMVSRYVPFSPSACHLTSRNLNDFNASYLGCSVRRAGQVFMQVSIIDGKAHEALKEYQASLAADPNRFNGLLGAGRAAERLGERDVAANYYRTLLANCAGANGSALVALRHPQTFVDETAIRPASRNASTTTNQ